MVRRKRRVRMHLVDNPGVNLPSVEGVLYSRRGSEYLIAAASVHWAAGAEPDRPDARFLAIPRERVAFYEVIG